MGKEYDSIIIGAGLAGLVAAHELKKQGQSVLVLESSNHIGGAITTREYQGSSKTYYEMGPNSFLSNSEPIMKLVQELGLQYKLITTPFKGSKRYVYFEEELVEVPKSPLSFLLSPLLSIGAKLRILSEPLCSKKAESEDESVKDFLYRRFGHELHDNLAATFMQGIWAGDTSKLSAKAILKKFSKAEAEYGSVIKGLIKSKKTQKGEQLEHPKLVRELSTCSFREGMSTLTDELANTIGRENILTNTQVKLFEARDNFYSLEIDGSKVYTKNLILATKAFEAADLLKGSSCNRLADLAKLLNRVYYAPLALFAMAIPKQDQDFEGFGFLVDERAQTKTIGTLWSSKMFKDRDLSDEYVFVSILGGAKKTDLLELDNLAELAIKEQKKLLGLPAETEIKIIEQKFINKAIPQYNIGYLELIEQVRSEMIPGLHLAGNYLGGVSLADTITESQALVKQI